MSNLLKLPRDLIAKFATDPRSLRFIENLQDQVFEIMPDQIKRIYSAIQQAQLSADSAQSTAIQALNKPNNEQLPMVGVPIYGSDNLPLSIVNQNQFNNDLSVIGVNINQDCGLVAVPLL